MSHRQALLNRLQQADDAAKQVAGLSAQTSLDRGALVEALVADGASYREIGEALGVTKQSVQKMLDRYRRALERTK